MKWDWMKRLNICALVNTNKGKAYIDFETQEDAHKAISYMDNVSNYDSPMRVLMQNLTYPNDRHNWMAKE